MAILTAAGITFGGGDSLNSRYGIIPQSTPMLFLRGTAPTFWTTVTTQNNKALRVVSGAGGNAGGVNSFTGTLTNQTFIGNVPVSISGLGAGGVTLSVNTVPLHAHPANSGGAGSGGSASPSLGSVGGAAPGSTTGNYGNTGAHGHSITFTGASGVGAFTMDFRVLYVDCIICTFN